jgi:hypothetical protein
MELLGQVGVHYSWDQKAVHCTGCVWRWLLFAFTRTLFEIDQLSGALLYVQLLQISILHGMATLPCVPAAWWDIE